MNRNDVLSAWRSLSKWHIAVIALKWPPSIMHSLCTQQSHTNRQNDYMNYLMLFQNCFSVKCFWTKLAFEVANFLMISLDMHVQPRFICITHIFVCAFGAFVWLCNAMNTVHMFAILCMRDECFIAYLAFNRYNKCLSFVFVIFTPINFFIFCFLPPLFSCCLLFDCQWLRFQFLNA